MGGHHIVGIELGLEDRDKGEHAGQLARDQGELAVRWGEVTAGGGNRTPFASPVHQAGLRPTVFTVGIEVFRRQPRGRAQRLQQLQAELGEQLPRLASGVAGQAAQSYQPLPQPVDILAQAGVDGTAQVVEKALAAIEDRTEIQ